MDHADEQDNLERIQRAEKEFNELLARENLTFVVREVLINGQRASFGIQFMPNEEKKVVVAPTGDSFLNRNMKRLINKGRA